MTCSLEVRIDIPQPDHSCQHLSQMSNMKKGVYAGAYIGAFAIPENIYYLFAQATERHISDSPLQYIASTKVVLMVTCAVIGGVVGSIFDCCSHLRA